MDTYKPYIKPKTPCKGTLQFKKQDNTNWENILAKIKAKKKEKHKTQFENNYNNNEINIYTDGSYNKENNRAGGGIHCEQLEWNKSIAIKHIYQSNAVAELHTIHTAINMWINQTKQDK